MSVTLEEVARNAAVDAVVGLLDGGTIEMQTDSDVEVATLSFGTPAFEPASGGTATANAITEDDDATGGDITKAVFKDSSEGPIFTVTVTQTGEGGTLELSSTSIGSGDTVSITSYTHTQPAS